MNITPAKFRRLFGELSPAQLSIVKDKDSKYIVAAAGPGSGKTRVLVHKLASLLLMEDVRHEQLLMLTFSRAAATEFRQRLRELIGNAVSFVEIRTFHSYCFDLLGQIGNLEKSEGIVKIAIDKILTGEVDASRVTKTVLVIDEAQDMDEYEYLLIKVLMAKNEDMRVLAVGDDDQNIYEFRGSSSVYMEEILRMEGAKKYELVENFRSRNNLVAFANGYAGSITHRIKNFPIVPVKKEDGELEIISYAGRNLIEPVTASVLSKSLSGTTAVLTRTNGEALLIAGILQRKGIPAQLIRSNTDFRLTKLSEIRFFKACLDFWNNEAVIPWEKWETAKSALKKEFSRSKMLRTCMDMLEDFESVCPDSTGAQEGKIIYKTDFDIFLKESSLEDFIRCNTDTVTVSTIHKVKGMEFDNVFLMLDNFVCNDDEARRQLYVALTRAKNNLYIHTNARLFSRIAARNMEVGMDMREYGKSPEMIMQLTLKDVWLDDFHCRQYAIDGLMSGDRLYVVGEGPAVMLADEKGRIVLQFSKKFKQEYEKVLEEGYRMDSAEVNMIVWWKNENREKEIKVLLPTLHFSLFSLIN